MSDPTDNGQGKGFAGLHGLSPRKVEAKGDQKPETPAPDSQPKLKEPEIPGAWKVSEGERLQRQPSQTSVPKWRTPVVMVVLTVIGLSLFGISVQQSNKRHQDDEEGRAAAAVWQKQAAIEAATSQDYTQPERLPAVRGDAADVAGMSSADAAAQAADEAATAAVEAAMVAADPSTADPTIPTGLTIGDEVKPARAFDQVLYAPQIRYCVREKIRMDAAEKIVDAYDGNAVDRYNAMVNDLNGRCGSFRYRSGTLEPIRSEAESIRSQLEQQGRNRFSVAPKPTPRSALPLDRSPADQSDDQLRIDSDSRTASVEYRKNFSTCISGSYPILCKHQLLTPEDAARVERAELSKNFETCSTGRYPVLCKHELLTEAQADQVEKAELDRNYETCISGRYPVLCKHDKLTFDQAERVRTAELDRNYETCITGRYPVLCKHNLLTEEQAIAVTAAEGR